MTYFNRKRKSSMKKKDFAVGLAVGMACGLVLGAAAGMLLAPASGEQTRRRLRFERDNAVDAARRVCRRARLLRAGPEEEREEEEGAFSGA
jgi:gas vesicle protein